MIRLPFPNAPMSDHDWRCTHFGFHVQYRCANCHELDSYIYETGEREKPAPPLVCRELQALEDDA